MSRVRPEHGHVFIHVPKNAGSSMEQISWVSDGRTRHMSIQEIIAKGSDALGGKLHKDLFKWGFVRNPYDRAVSMFHYWSGLNKSLFKNWLATRDFDAARYQWEWLTYNGELIMDFVGRYERLHEDWAYVCKRLGLDVAPLPHLRESNRTKWTDYFDAESIELINKKCHMDFEYFGYEKL